MKNNETIRREKFLKLANLRTNSILKSLSSLSKLSNTRHYEFNDKDIQKIFNAIQVEIKISKAMFDKQLKKGDFKL